MSHVFVTMSQSHMHRHSLQRHNNVKTTGNTSSWQTTFPHFPSCHITLSHVSSLPPTSSSMSSSHLWHFSPPHAPCQLLATVIYSPTPLLLLHRMSSHLLTFISSSLVKLIDQLIDCCDSFIQCKNQTFPAFLFHIIVSRITLNSFDLVNCENNWQING